MAEKLDRWPSSIVRPVNNSTKEANVPSWRHDGTETSTQPVTEIPQNRPGVRKCLGIEILGSIIEYYNSKFCEKILSEHTSTTEHTSKGVAVPSLVRRTCKSER